MKAKPFPAEEEVITKIPAVFKGKAIINKLFTVSFDETSRY